MKQPHGRARLRRVVQRAAAVATAAAFLAVPTARAATGDGASHQAAAASGCSVEGYWFTASDGGIFGFGAADFHGSLGSLTLNSPIVGMASNRNGDGYWLVATDGGLFSFGKAVFYGSAAAVPLNRPVVAMANTFPGNGYWLVASDGGIFNYGDAAFCGSTGSITLNRPVVGIGFF